MYYVAKLVKIPKDAEFELQKELNKYLAGDDMFSKNINNAQIFSDPGDCDYTYIVKEPKDFCENCDSNYAREKMFDKPYIKWIKVKLVEA